MIIQVGFLVDSLQVPAWQFRIITFVKNHPSCSLCLVVLNDSGDKPTQPNREIYRLLRKFDRAVHSTPLDNFAFHDAGRLLADVESLQVRPVTKKFTDEIVAADITAIESKGLDIIVRLGFRILKGGILNAARHGVWSLHHGDNWVKRGGPPEFWEVVNKEPVTGVTLQVLSDDLDAGRVLGKAFVRTNLTLFTSQQNALYLAGIELLCSTLSLFSERGPDLFFKSLEKTTPDFDFYSKNLNRDPKNGKAFGISIGFLWRRVRDGLTKVFRDQQWLLYYRLGSTGIEKAMFRYRALTPPRGCDWADPFVMMRDGSYFVFLEELIRKKGIGHISYLKFDANGRPVSKTAIKIIGEPYHMSYPFILEHEQTLYMIPETASTKTVHLYSCDEFPHRWTKLKPLLEDVELFDPTLHFHEGSWYFFGTTKPLEGSSADQYMIIYFTVVF